MRDKGSMLVLVMFVGLGLTAAITTAMMPVLLDVHERQRAAIAADAAALAGVVDGRDAAARLASLNGGELVGWSAAGDTVTVTVRVGEQHITARATNGP